MGTAGISPTTNKSGTSKRRQNKQKAEQRYVAYKKGRKPKYAGGVAAVMGKLGGAKSGAAAAGGKGGGAAKGASGMMDKIGKNNPWNKISGAAGMAGDIAGLWASTQGDEKAAKMAKTFKGVQGATGVIGKEKEKQMQAAAKTVVGAKTGNPSMVADGVQQGSDKGTNMSDFMDGGTENPNKAPKGGLNDPKMYNNMMANPGAVPPGQAMAKMGLYMKPKSKDQKKRKKKGGMNFTRKVK